MRTNKEFVSRIVNDLKAVNKDRNISRRHVLHIGKEKAGFLLAQKWDEMTLNKEEGMITHIDCVQFESIDVKRCDIFEFKLCRSLMKSNKQIPELIYGKNGPAIIHVTTVDGEKQYTYISPREYNSIAKRKYIIKDSRYFYIKDGHIYLPNSDTELLDISVITLNKKESEKCSTCGDSDGGDKKDKNGKKIKCKSVWDYEFVCPDRFYDLVAKDTIQELASIWRSSPEDNNPNLNSNEG